MTYQLEAVDVEGDVSYFLDQERLWGNSLDVYVVAPADLAYNVDFNTGLLTVTPSNSVSGTLYFTVATGVSIYYIDYQVVAITVGEAVTSAAAPAGR
jgi:hypothetical protein